MSPHKENDLLYLLNILEYSGKISEELKQEYQDIEWQSIKDFRNKIVHNYAGIDIDIVFEIITEDLRKLKPKIEQIIVKKIGQKVFNIDELNLAKESEFYRYVDFSFFSG